MKTLKKVIALVLCLVTVFSCFSMSVYAANYTSRYGNYNSPENSGDWAQYKNKKVKRSSSTSVDEVRWMQAALNYCMDAEGLNKINGYNVSKLDVDGSFGPASKKVTEAFQKAAGLTVDGSFGPSTIKKMKSVLNDKKTNSLVPNATVSRPTNTTTTTTTNTSTNNTFKQQNIIQYSTTSNSDYISGDWYKLSNGNCSCCEGSFKNEYNEHEYIQGGGCGIVSLVSAVYNLGGTIEKNKIGTAIEEVFNWAYKNNHWKYSAYWTLVWNAKKEFGDKYGFDVIKGDNKTYFCTGSYGQVNTDLSDLVNHLKNNKGTAVVHVNGHFMAAVDYMNDNGVEKIRIFDPSPGGRRGSYTAKKGAWIELSVLKEGSVSNSLDFKKYKSTVSKENIEIDAYWLISKK